MEDPLATPVEFLIDAGAILSDRQKGFSFVTLKAFTKNVVLLAPQVPLYIALAGSPAAISQAPGLRPDGEAGVASQTRGSGVLEELRSASYTSSTGRSSDTELRAHAIMVAQARGELTVFSLA